MKCSPFRIFSFLSVLLFFAASCNNESKTESTDSDSLNKTNETVASTSTIVTTPQHMVLVKHRVKDFAAWKAGYDAHDSARLANGLHNYVISRGLEDSSMVMVAIKADDMDKAKAFTKDASLKQVMQKAGVVGSPVIQYVTMTFQDTAAISSPFRSETVFRVKDWTAWEKNFKDGEQERIDNGITVRAYGHDPDNDTRVRLVTALIDTAKARAYWNSDMVKKRRAAGGVIGEPERFVFRVVQRY